jgi:hypothetical protein
MATSGMTTTTRHDDSNGRHDDGGGRHDDGDGRHDDAARHEHDEDASMTTMMG